MKRLFLVAFLITISSINIYTNDKSSLVFQKDVSINQFLSQCTTQEILDNKEYKDENLNIGIKDAIMILYEDLCRLKRNNNSHARRKRNITFNILETKKLRMIKNNLVSLNSYYGIQ